MTVRGLGFRLAVHRGGDDDDLGLFPFAGDTQVEGIFLRAGIVGVVFLLDFAGGGRASESNKFLLLFAEVEGA